MKICIIGSVGDNTETCSGQILRTKILKESLENRYGKRNVVMVNTNNYLKQSLRIIYEIIFSLFSCNCFIVLLSQNGRRVIYPIMYVYKKLFFKHVFNNVVGGGYANDLKNNPRQIKFSKTFDINWVQSQKMMTELKKMEVNNVEVLPNSKPQRISNKLIRRSVIAGGKYIFCTFSRIMKEKGIEEAIEAIEKANKMRGRNDLYLRIYGSVEKQYEGRFNQILNNVSSNVEYMGYVAPDRTTDVLEESYVLLFPTKWSGEGFPGTVLDGFAAGLPVIATNWNCNAEIIQNGYTGIIYNANQNDVLVNHILWTVSAENKIDEMRVNCVREAQKYSPENVMPIIYNRIDCLDRR